MKEITIRYFAILREQARLEHEQVSTECKTYADLYKYLSEKHKFSIPPEVIQVAVNDEFTQMKDEICSNSRVVFIPPVAGG